MTSDGVKLTARSTGKTSRDEALFVVADWLKTGLPIGGLRGSGQHCKQKPISVIADLAGILSAIKKANLDKDSAFTIVSALKK
ncbi:hypothetical protein AGMMS4952_06370 [Spirochaetia bacterium]|nr:hypothetical protein AGMMS4952_06370 [Spirochaetia bacterium]